MFDYAMTAGSTATNTWMVLPMWYVRRMRSRARDLAPPKSRVFPKAVMVPNIRRQFEMTRRRILLTLVRKSERMLAHWGYVDTEKAGCAGYIRSAPTSEESLCRLRRPRLS